jgi:hypothetical protein
MIDIEGMGWTICIREMVSGRAITGWNIKHLKTIVLIRAPLPQCYCSGNTAGVTYSTTHLKRDVIRK